MRKLALLPVLALTMSLLATLPGNAAPRPFVPPAGAQRIAGGWAVPMTAKAPAWYTPGYHRQVIAAGPKGVPVPPGITVPAAAGLAYPGIRPGQWLITIINDSSGIGFAWCSANFVFTKSSKGQTTYGLGTAGHCAAKDALGSFPDVTAYVVPPVGSGQLPGFYHIGKFSLSHNNGVGDDFAMISIYPKYNSWMNPTMPVWGGPIGVYKSSTPTVVEHFGHGLVVGTGGTARAGAAYTFTARSSTAFAWYGVGFEGDSGSGVRAVTGEAVGDFTHIVIYDGTRNSLTGEILPGSLTGTRMTKILQIASGWTFMNGSIVPL